MDFKRARIKCFITGVVLSVCVLLVLLHVTGPSGGKSAFVINIAVVNSIFLVFYAADRVFFLYFLR